MSQAPVTPPVRSRPHLGQEVRDVKTGQLLAWVNGDKQLQRALTTHGMDVRPAPRAGRHRSSRPQYAGVI